MTAPLRVELVACPVCGRRDAVPFHNAMWQLEQRVARLEAQNRELCDQIAQDLRNAHSAHGSHRGEARER